MQIYNPYRSEWGNERSLNKWRILCDRWLIAFLIVMYPVVGLHSLSPADFLFYCILDPIACGLVTFLVIGVLYAVCLDLYKWLSGKNL